MEFNGPQCCRTRSELIRRSYRLRL
jgi:hypothetical protein